MDNGLQSDGETHPSGLPGSFQDQLVDAPRRPSSVPVPVPVPASPAQRVESIGLQRDSTQRPAQYGFSSENVPLVTSPPPVLTPPQSPSPSKADPAILANAVSPKSKPGPFSTQAFRAPDASAAHPSSFSRVGPGLPTSHSSTNPTSSPDLSIAPPPRRHTGGFARTRSALSHQMTEMTSSGAAGSATPFYGPGHEGGRKAARDRARHPSLANLDNAPFSVLEQMRSQGLRVAAENYRSNSGSFFQQGSLRDDATDEDGQGTLESSSDSVDRPLSPIAHASPDAQWSAALLLRGPTSPMARAEGSQGFASLSHVGAQMAADGPGELPAESARSGDPLATATGSPGFLARTAAATDNAQGQCSPSFARDDAHTLRRVHSRPAMVVPPWETQLTSRSSSPNPAIAPPSFEPAPRMSHDRPNLSRASTSATVAPGAAIVEGAPGALTSHVLRTPTTEEWARYLASQGLDPGRPLSSSSRSRTATGRSLANLASSQYRSGLSGSTGSLTPLDAIQRGDSAVEMQSDPSEDEVDSDDSEDGRELADAIYRLQVASSRAGSTSRLTLDSLSSLSLDDVEPRSTRPRSDSSSSDSSQGRMEALHAAISMPPSRRGSPPLPPGTSDEAVRRANEVHSRSIRSPRLDAAPVVAGGYPKSVDPLPTQQVQLQHGYVPPASNHKRSIDDFNILSDVGRGAYGLVKLARLKAEDGLNSFGPEFVIKYIIKSRILADCWRRHRILGPIPVEIHVMDQLRRFPYRVPAHSAAWGPEKLWYGAQEHTHTPPRTPGAAGRELHLPDGDDMPATPMQARRNTLVEDGTERQTPINKASAQGLMLTPGAQQQQSPPSATAFTTHPGLCTMLDFFEDDSFYYLVMPRFGQGTDLFDYIESRPNGLSTREARVILGQVTDGVQFLHDHNIVHRDIKDENVILDGQGHAQLIDFGSAAHVKSGRLFDTFSGTLDYAAAEILRGDKYAGKEQDVWALGVVAYVCLVGDAPFWNGEEAMRGLQPGTRAMSALEERCMRDEEGESAASTPDAEVANPSSDSTVGTIESEQDHLFNGHEDEQGQVDGGGKLKDAMDLIEQCLSLNTGDRPSAKEVTRHIFLAGQVSGSWRGPRGWLTAMTA